MRFYSRFLQVLVILTEGKEQCGDKKRIKLVKKYLDALKDAMLESGCQKKPSNRNEKNEKKPSASWQPTSAPSSPDDATSTMGTTKGGPESLCPFVPVEGVSKNITCFLSDADMENGLNLEKLINLRLCTDVIMLVKHSYDDVPTGKSTFQYLNQTRESANVEKWRSLNLRIFMHIGSWDNQKRLSGPQFSRYFEMPKARDRITNALVSYLEKSNFDGLLISWYYPGCVQDDCKSGPLKDDPNSISFLKKFTELTKEKSIKLKIAVEVSIRSDNMILSYKLNELVKYVDLLLFENTCPENRVFTGPKDVHNKISRIYEQFGTLDDTSKSIDSALKKYAKVNPGNVLMELETTTVYASFAAFVGENKWRVKNITAKNLFKLVLSASEVIRNTTYKWPLNFIGNETVMFPFNDFDYMKARVDEYLNNLRLGGVWIRDLWADDMDNECNCGAFPILRAANEAVGRSTCKLPNCPTKKN